MSSQTAFQKKKGKINEYNCVFFNNRDCSFKVLGQGLLTQFFSFLTCSDQLSIKTLQETKVTCGFEDQHLVGVDFPTFRALIQHEYIGSVILAQYILMKRK